MVEKPCDRLRRTSVQKYYTVACLSTNVENAHSGEIFLTGFTVDDIFSKC
jgi:hypothetical protein